MRFKRLHSRLSFVSFVRLPKVAGSDSKRLEASSKICKFIRLPKPEGRCVILFLSRTSCVRRVKCATGSTLTSLFEVSESEISVWHFISAIFSGRI